MLTYGDGVSDINIPELIKNHLKSGKTVTLTTVKPTGRFGSVEANDDGTVESFLEKPDGNAPWIPYETNMN